MTDYIPYLVFGLTAGSIYGISAMGLVLTYKTSGLFNVGHGAICAAAAYVFYDLRERQGMPWPLAALLAVGVFGIVVGLLMERLATVLANVTITNKIVATIGLLVAVRYLVVMRYGPTALSFDPFLPTGEAFRVQGVQVSWSNVINLLLGIAAAVLLYLLFRVTRLGVAMRGVVDDAALLDMAGTSPAAVRRASWLIGCSFAAMSGVLFASVQSQLDVNILSLLVVQAFGAAAIGRFTSLPLAFVGGLLVGVLQAIASKEVSGYANLQGLDTTVPFLVMFVVLLVTPRRKLIEVGRFVKARPAPPSPFSPGVRVTGYGSLAVAALLVPHVVGTRLPFYLTAVTQLILFLSLSLLVRTSGQISLCHVGFAAIGAAAFGHLLGRGVPWFLALFLGGLVLVPVGAVLAIPAIRLSGLFLGLATLGFGILLTQFAYAKPYMFGFADLKARRPDGFESDTAYYYLLLGIASVCLLIVLLAERARLGRLLRAMADSPTALTTSGADTNISRVIVFCISAFIAGISGGTFASLFGSVNGDAFYYLDSLSILAILMISGRRTVLAAVVAALLYKVMPGYINDVQMQNLFYVGFGVVAIAVAALSQGQLAAWIARRAKQSEERRSAELPALPEDVEERWRELLRESDQLSTAGAKKP